MTAYAEPLRQRWPAASLPPRWLVGWWLAGRVVVLAAAAAVHPSVWTLDRWDGRWYRMVARDGYLLVPGRQSDPAFFPLYPSLIRGVHALGASWGVAGPLVSNVALLGALFLFHALTKELLGAEVARRATSYLAVFPLGEVFSMSYPESVVLALVAAAPLAALRRRWGFALSCGAAAALARPEGLFVALPLAGIAWAQRPSLRPAERGLALGAVLAPAAALASYPLYLATVLNDPLAWTKAEHAWGRQFRPLGILSAVQHLPGVLAADPWLARDVVCFLVYLGLLAAAWRGGVPRAWLLAGAGIVVLPAFSGSFESISRFGLLAPALVWGLALVTRSPRSERIVLATSLALLALSTVTLTYVFP